jgi:hypothetical protein
MSEELLNKHGTSKSIFKYERASKYETNEGFCEGLNKVPSLPVAMYILSTSPTDG